MGRRKKRLRIVKMCKLRCWIHTKPLYIVQQKKVFWQNWCVSLSHTRERFTFCHIPTTYGSNSLSLLDTNSFIKIIRQIIKKSPLFFVSLSFVKTYSHFDFFFPVLRSDFSPRVHRWFNRLPWNMKRMIVGTVCFFIASKLALYSDRKWHDLRFLFHHRFSLLNQHWSFDLTQEF